MNSSVKADALKVPASLLRTSVSFNEYSDVGASAKDAMHRQGSTFLRKLAASLGLEKGDFDVRSNRAGIAVSGEVTLHSDDIYIQMSESCLGERGLSLLYRTCSHRKDYCGHTNNFIHLSRLRDREQVDAFIGRLSKMIACERERKNSLTNALPGQAATLKASPAQTQAGSSLNLF